MFFKILTTNSMQQSLTWFPDVLWNISHSKPRQERRQRSSNELGGHILRFESPLRYCVPRLFDRVGANTEMQKPKNGAPKTNLFGRIPLGKNVTFDSSHPINKNIYIFLSASINVYIFLTRKGPDFQTSQLRWKTTANHSGRMWAKSSNRSLFFFHQFHLWWKAARGWIGNRSQSRLGRCGWLFPQKKYFLLLLEIEMGCSIFGFIGTWGKLKNLFWFNNEEQILRGSPARRTILFQRR